jgi:hypothetical protein
VFEFGVLDNAATITLSDTLQSVGQLFQQPQFNDRVMESAILGPYPDPSINLSGGVRAVQPGAFFSATYYTSARTLSVRVGESTPATETRTLLSPLGFTHAVHLGSPRAANDVDFFVSAWVYANNQDGDTSVNLVRVASTPCGDFGEHVRGNTSYLIRTKITGLPSLNNLTSSPQQTRELWEVDGDAPVKTISEPLSFFPNSVSPIAAGPFLVNGENTFFNRGSILLQGDQFDALSVSTAGVLCGIYEQQEGLDEEGRIVWSLPERFFASVSQGGSAAIGDLGAVRYTGLFLAPAPRVAVLSRWFNEFSVGDATGPSADYYDVTLSPVASVSALIEDPTRPELEGGWKSTISTQGRATLPTEIAKIHDRDAESFVPRVPKSLDEDSTTEPLSWFGLRTSLDPSPRCTFSECSSPSEPQQPGSLIANGGGRSGFTMTIEMYGQGSRRSLFDLNPTFQFDQLGTQNVWTTFHTTSIPYEFTPISNPFGPSSDDGRTSASNAILVAYQGTVHASRTARVYPDIKTSTLGELVMTMHFMYFMTSEFSLGQGTRQARHKGYHSASVVLTEEQEQRFAAGQSVSLSGFFEFYLFFVCTLN